MGLKTGLDFVTRFGVANVDVDYFNEQVISSGGVVLIGPHRIVWTLMDVGNTNTHCYTGTCRNVFDINIEAEVVEFADHPVSVLTYQ